MDETLKEVALVHSSGAPCRLERLVGLEVRLPPDQPQAALEVVLDRHAVSIGNHHCGGTFQGVPTILLSGVDLFFRAKLEGLLPGHHLVTHDSVEAPELVIADIARVDPAEVADAYPDIPIVGFANHTDTAGLRAAHAAGFDQVLAKSALVERASLIVDALIASVDSEP